MLCLKTSLWLCTGFANSVKGALAGKPSLLLQIVAWCLVEGEVMSGGGLARIPKSSSSVVAGPTEPCEDNIQGLSTLGTVLQRGYFIKALFTLYSLCFSSDTAHGSQKIISWTLAW